MEQLQTISTPYREEAEGRCSSDMLAEVLGSESCERQGSLSPTSGPDSGAASLLPIVQAQRERLRLRTEELETQGLEQQQQVRHTPVFLSCYSLSVLQVSLLSRQVQDLQADNLKLYEKIRFLQVSGLLTYFQLTKLPPGVWWRSQGGSGRSCGDQVAVLPGLCSSLWPGTRTPTNRSWTPSLTSVSRRNRGSTASCQSLRR